MPDRLIAWLPNCLTGCTLGERIRPQIDVSYEYVEEGDALDLRCNVRVGSHVFQFYRVYWLTLYNIADIHKTWEFEQ